jgi:DNA-binding transcriptional regulator/RsmH inhibitor MraZ
VDLARCLATAWRIPVSVETSRISFTVPEPIRRAQLLSGHGGTVIAFGSSEIFQVWEEVKWHDHVRGVAKTKLYTTEEAIENLRDRSG